MRVLVVAVASMIVGSGVGAWSAYNSVGEQRSAEDLVVLREGSEAESTDYPKFEIDSRLHNFGAMQRGTSREHSFLVTNTGRKPLTVAVTSTTCKCTAGEIINNPVPPGETTEVKLSWVAKTVAGGFRQTATLETNDPRARRVELTVEGMVTEVGGVEPKEWFFDKIRLGEGRSESVYVMAFEQDDLVIESAELDHEDARKKYKLEMVKVPKSELLDPQAKAGYRVDVTPLDSLALGPINDWVVMKTNIKGAEELRVPILGNVVGDIEIRGPSAWNDVTGAVHLGNIQSDQGAEIKLFLNVGGEHAKDIQFELAEVEPKYLEVELGEPKQLRDDLSHVPLVVRVPKGLPAAIHNGTGQGEAGHVVLKTNHPTNSEISFDIRYIIKRPSVTK